MPILDTEPVLILDKVFAGYGKMTILHGTSFAVPRNAITTVIGPNGAGKSTAFKTIFGMVRASAGRISFDGADITNLPPRALIERGIVYVPQGRNIFPELSVRHNLELGGIAAPPHLDVATRLEQALDRFPVLRRKANQQASTLSGGEQKMLEIARCLLLEPKLMLIDEPSIGLSPLLVSELFSLLKDIKTRGVTVLMIEQNAKRALESSDYGIVLELGQTRMFERADKLLADPRVGQLFLGGTIEAAKGAA